MDSNRLTDYCSQHLVPVVAGTMVKKPQKLVSVVLHAACWSAAVLPPTFVQIWQIWPWHLDSGDSRNDVCIYSSSRSIKSWTEETWCDLFAPAPAVWGYLKTLTHMEELADSNFLLDTLSSSRGSMSPLPQWKAITYQVTWPRGDLATACN